MYNILTEPIIRYAAAAGNRVAASLPDIYAALMADEVVSFPALRPHQRHAFHSVLVQLGAMTMHRAGVDIPPESAEEWAKLIRGLTSDYPNDEPWQLVVEDITKPAFMQPPASSAAKEEEYGTKSVKRGKQIVRVPDEDKIARSPDELDMLVTSKNHDLKSSVAAQASVDDWIFALITLQTMEGYGGRYNYGISRMPSGYGNRPAFSFTPSTRPGLHVRHDLVTLLKHRQLILDEYPMTDKGIALLWVILWDGTKAEKRLITELEPFYIEVCRRVRLHGESGKLTARRANSDDWRIVEAKGLVGDPWMPVSNNTNPKGTPPAFLGRRKFGYERVVDGLTSPDWKAPLLLKTMPNDKDTQLVARGMVRGEGGTEGYHERVIPLRQKTIQAFGTANGPKELGDLAKERIEQIAKVQRGLRFAVSVFAAGGKTENIPDEHRSRANPWANELGEMVDRTFFDDLQTEFEAAAGDRESIRSQWLMNGKCGVVDHANNILRDAENSLPCPSIQRYKAKALAESVFRGWLRGKNGIPKLF